MSTGDEASRFARFSFRRHFFQHLGFRVARSTSPSAPPPVRLCTAEVFVLGAGVTSKHLCAVCMCCSLRKCVLFVGKDLHTLKLTAVHSELVLIDSQIENLG